jgi:hypothetical protein
VSDDADQMASIEEVLEENVRRGWMKHAGVDDDGNQRYQLTVTGKEAVEAGFETGQMLIDEDKDPRPPRYGPMQADHPVVGDTCKACGELIAVGDFTTIATLGPGSDPEQRAKCAAGRPYTAIGVVCHYACVTGIEGG